eukprot:161435-Prymnesium_polylepis.1
MKPPEPLNRAKWSCTAWSQSLKLRQPFCAPPSQQGRGFIFLPENRSPVPSGNTSKTQQIPNGPNVAPNGTVRQMVPCGLWFDLRTVDPRGTA